MSGFNYAINMGAKISSNSWGGVISLSQTQFLRNVLNNNPDHLFIAAAGNENSQVDNSRITCGANAPNQICVGSTTRFNDRSSFSNYGTPYVHVMAPGSKIA